MKTAKEILDECSMHNYEMEGSALLTGIDYDDALNAMEEYAKIKWGEACEYQVEICSDKVFDLLNTDDDAETWHEKVMDSEKPKFEDYL